MAGFCFAPAAVYAYSTVFFATLVASNEDRSAAAANDRQRTRASQYQA